MVAESTTEAHRLNYPKYVRRLRKFNDNNDVDSLSEKMYENSRICLYQIEINEITLSKIRKVYKTRPYWTKKEIERMISYIRNAYPDDWFKKRASRKWNNSQKAQEKGPDWQYDINFNEMPVDR